MGNQVFPTANPAVRKAITATDRSRTKSYFQPYYHYREYPAAGVSNMSFFGVPYTQAPGGLDDTNMLSAGVLTQRSLEVTAIELLFLPGVQVAAASVEYAQDVQAVFQSGRLELKINDEQILQDGPVGLFACPSRLYVEGVAYAAFVGPQYKITNVVIPANTSFGINLAWNTPVQVSDNARIGVRLIGVESRVA